MRSKACPSVLFRNNRLADIGDWSLELEIEDEKEVLLASMRNGERARVGVRFAYRLVVLFFPD